MFIADKRGLRVFGMILRSGVMKYGLISATNEGTVQGGPLGLLLWYVVLDELDKELEKRAWIFVDLPVTATSWRGPVRMVLWANGGY